MSGFENENEVKDTDIVFDCPYCSKSLAIDYRGAGLTIQCSDCGSDVQVPIPDGMELDDIDSTTEEQEIRIMHLRRSLATAQQRIQQLEAEVDGLNARRIVLERSRTEGLYRIGEIVERAAFLDSLLQEATKTASKLFELCREEIPDGASDKDTSPEAQRDHAPEVPDPTDT